jgi:hypothetical protein
MTMTCCLGNTKSEIHAITETPAKLLMIPIGKWKNGPVNTRPGATLSSMVTPHA